jgi:succinate dehydrogenase / fumarate reductase cytochrome b subunit
MAATGGALILFLFGHMAGNLQIFLGPEAINRYGHFLQSNKEILWPARLGLLALVGLHVWSAIQVTLENQAARSVGYRHEIPAVGSGFAARNMLAGGLIIASFAGYHLLHYTALVPAVNLTGQHFGAPAFTDAHGQHDIYKMVIVGFNQPLVVLFYLVGVGTLCLHLSHGAASLFQSLGWNSHVYRNLIDQAAKVLAVVLFAGYLAVPVAVLLGFGKEVLK